MQKTALTAVRRFATMANTSAFTKAPLFPKDAIFALTVQCKNDPSSLKVNLGQGAYRDESNQPWILPSVMEARRQVSNRKLDHEYLPILGLPEFRQAAARMVLGEQTYDNIKSKVASSQSLSGTGGLSLAGKVLRQFSTLEPDIWIPEPTWSNHHLVYSSLGFKCHTFPYYNYETKTLDIESYTAALKSAEPGSIVILHACAHNPTGCDPSKEQWTQIGQIMKERQLFPLFDSAYLGFNSGSVDNDAYAIRLFVNDLQMEVAVAVSFAKNMGLYGERVGCTFFVTQSTEVATNIESVLERLQRAEVSNPPAFGAKIASKILNDPALTQTWSQDLVTMCSRIRQMRQALYDGLISHGAPGDWSHVTSQSGMFSFLGLEYDVVIKLREKYHIYMADNSRISIAGLNTSNVDYVAKSIAECLGASKTHSTGQPAQARL